MGFNCGTATALGPTLNWYQVVAKIHEASTLSWHVLLPCARLVPQVMACWCSILRGEDKQLWCWIICTIWVPSSCLFQEMLREFSESHATFLARRATEGRCPSIRCFDDRWIVPFLGGVLILDYVWAWAACKQCCLSWRFCSPWTRFHYCLWQRSDHPESQPCSSGRCSARLQSKLGPSGVSLCYA